MPFNNVEPRLDISAIRLAIACPWLVTIITSFPAPMDDEKIEDKGHKTDGKMRVEDFYCQGKKIRPARWRSPHIKKRQTYPDKNAWIKSRQKGIPFINRKQRKNYI